MNEQKKPVIAALVPMRHSSERVPGKNYRAMAGKPLYAYILETLQKSPSIDSVLVDTDSPVIRDGIFERFPEVRVVERPEHLRAGTVPMNDVLLHDISLVQADFYLQTHSTNPLLRPETIERAVHAFLEAWPEKDSLFSVTRWQTRLYRQNGAAVNHNPAELLRTQDLPPVFEENSCIYIFTKQGLSEHGHRIGRNPILFEIDREEAWDIDEELDFSIVELLVRQGISPVL